MGRTTHQANNAPNPVPNSYQAELPGFIDIPATPIAWEASTPRGMDALERLSEFVTYQSAPGEDLNIEDPVFYAIARTYNDAGRAALLRAGLSDAQLRQLGDCSWPNMTQGSIIYPTDEENKSRTTIGRISKAARHAMLGRQLTKIEASIGTIAES